MDKIPEINRRLKVALARKGLTQFQAGLLTGIHPTTFSQLVRGYFAPTSEQIEKLRKIFTRKQIDRIFN